MLLQLQNERREREVFLALAGAQGRLRCSPAGQTEALLDREEFGNDTGHLKRRLAGEDARFC